MTSARSSCKDRLERILPGSPQDLLTRTCTRACKDLCEDTSQGSPQEILTRRCAISCKGLLEDVSRIFTRSCHEDLYKIMQGTLTEGHQDLHNIFSQGPLQDLGPDLHILRTCETAPWNSCKVMKVWKDLPKNSQDLFTRISRNQLNSAPHQNESDPTRTKCQEGCRSHVKIRTTPQRERSDAPKLPRRLRERYQNS